MAAMGGSAAASASASAPAAGMGADTHPFRAGLLVVGDAARAELRRFAVACSDGDWAALVRRIAASLRVSATAASAAATPSAGTAEATVAALYADFVRCATPASVAESSLEELGVPLAKARTLSAALTAAAEENRRALAAASECASSFPAHAPIRPRGATPACRALATRSNVAQPHRRLDVAP